MILTVVAVTAIILFGVCVLAAFVALAWSWDKSDREAYRLSHPDHPRGKGRERTETYQL